VPTRPSSLRVAIVSVVLTVGSGVKSAVGMLVTDREGLLETIVDGEKLGSAVSVGGEEKDAVGVADGAVLCSGLGAPLGDRVGPIEGAAVGPVEVEETSAVPIVGTAVGAIAGGLVSTSSGGEVLISGILLGEAVGEAVVNTEGNPVGFGVGILLGDSEGRAVGCPVTTLGTGLVATVGA
jgi:hypothetical protein